MSWAAYTERLVSSKVDLCAIHGLDGRPWAQVPAFICSPGEVAAVASALANKDSSIYGSGVVMAGKRWTVIRLEPEMNSIILKGKDADNQKQTLVVSLGAQSVVIGANKDENVSGPAVLVAVQGMRDYLKGCGY